MTASSTAYNITHYVSDAVIVSALAMNRCLSNEETLLDCKHKLHEYIVNYDMVSSQDMIDNNVYMKSSMVMYYYMYYILQTVLVSRILL